MLKKLFLPIYLSAIIAAMVGCNSTSDEATTYELSSAVSVTSFYINDNSKVLDSLSNVFFSIDLVEAKIFNADSLPYGTNVSRLIPSITVATGATEVQLKYYCPETGRDSLVNYLTNSTDSIDFSGGPVQLTVVSQSGLVKRDYQIKVNVHQVKSDSLSWYSMASAPLPTTFKAPKAQCTAKLGDTYYCLTSDGSSYCLSTTADPADPAWATREIVLPFQPKVSSLRSTDAALYMLSVDGSLYSSTDCIDWSDTGEDWHYIYGAYGNDIIGSVTSTAGNSICSYPGGKIWPMDADFPIDGTSVPTTYTLSMGLSPQLVMLGGRRADDTLSASAWSFDGSEWTEISTLQLPIALQDITMVPYQLVELPSTTWTPFDYPVLLAFGGRDKQGAINRTVYYSRDWGMTWREAPETVQLPQGMPTFYGASAFTHSTIMYPSRSSQWSELPLRPLPPHWSYIWLPEASRAVAPITEWECQAIYLFGGKDYDGATLNTLWRGVILQFTFEPLQ